MNIPRDGDAFALFQELNSQLKILVHSLKIYTKVEFHVFSIIWTENEIRWLVDDQPYHFIDITESDFDEFRNSFFFIFNIAVGGNWPGSPDVTTIFPQRMAVDYLRGFQEE